MAKERRLPRAFTERLEFCGLTDKEKDDIRKRAEEQVRKERLAAAEEEFFEAALKDARAPNQKDLQLEDVLIDLPGHSVHIMIDGTMFLHGFVYEVNSLQGATIREMLQRAWDHEDEIGGANRNFYNQPRNLQLTRRSQNVNTARLLSRG